MTNLDLAKQLQEMAQQRLRELERILGIARSAGVIVEREVVTHNLGEGRIIREALNVRLMVRPGDVSTDRIEWPEDDNVMLAWREERGRGRLFFTPNIFGRDAVPYMRGRLHPTLIGVRGDEPFEVDEE